MRTPSAKKVAFRHLLVGSWDPRAKEFEAARKAIQVGDTTYFASSRGIGSRDKGDPPGRESTYLATNDRDEVLETAEELLNEPGARMVAIPR